MKPEDEGRIYVNGLNASTGDPLIAPFDYDWLADRIMSQYLPQRREEEQASYVRLSKSFRSFDETKLDDPSNARWGLIVPDEDADMLQIELLPLIKHRGAEENIFIYKRNEPIRKWKASHQADSINPEKFPYYILIAGSPEKVPFELQFSLGSLRPVGRIEFDNPEEYARYAQVVVNQETGQGPFPKKQALFFSPRHPGDYATNQSNKRLVRPLLDILPGSEGISLGLSFDLLAGDDATKANLMSTIEAEKTGQGPALLFIASHGAGIDTLKQHQRNLQGSIICQDCQFPLTPQKRHGFITSYDVNEGFCLPGGIAFLFACYGAGTRARSDFINFIPSLEGRKHLSNVQGEKDFVASLPKALLANPQGGSLAVIGHVDPAWVYSFESPVDKTRRIDPFGFSLARLLRRLSRKKS